MAGSYPPHQGPAQGHLEPSQSHQETCREANSNEGLAGDVTRFARTALGSGLMGRSGQKVGAALGVAQSGGGKSGGHLGSAAASGLMGRKGQMAARVLGLGNQKAKAGC